MKIPFGLCLLFACALGSEASAHGGGSWEGRRGRNPGIPISPGIECDCARTDCAFCSDGRLVGVKRLVCSEVAQRATRRWNDFAALRVTATFRAHTQWLREAHIRVAPSALFAVTGGSIRHGNSFLKASLRASQDARRRYLWSRHWSRRRGLDPLLVTWRAPGRCHLRAYPVRAKPDTVVTIEGFGLAAPKKRGAPRLYRTGDRVLIVRDAQALAAPLKTGEWADTAGQRVLSFHDVATARQRVGDRVDRAIKVPFVNAIETALTGHGTDAVENETALVALEPGAKLPPRVGPPPPEPAHIGNTKLEPPPPPVVVRAGPSAARNG